MIDFITLIIEGAVRTENTSVTGKTGICKACCSRQETINYQCHTARGKIYIVELCNECAAKRGF
jgi:hypothetical protein